MKYLPLLTLTLLLVASTGVATPAFAQSVDRLSNNPTLDGTDANHPAPTQVAAHNNPASYTEYLWLIVPFAILVVLTFAIYAQMRDSAIASPRPNRLDILSDNQNHYLGHLNMAGIKGGEIDRRSPQEIAHQAKMQDYERRLQAIYNDSEPLDNRDTEL